MLNSLFIAQVPGFPTHDTHKNEFSNVTMLNALTPIRALRLPPPGKRQWAGLVLPRGHTTRTDTEQQTEMRSSML